MKIGIYSNEYQKREVIEKIIKTLFSNNIEIFIQKEFYNYLISFTNSRPYISGIIESDTFPLDMVLSIGGDGTFLRTVSALQNKCTPILGVNTGRLGFLAEISDEELEQTLTETLTGDYFIEERARLKLTVDNNKSESYIALNEVAVLKQDLASMITVTMYINGELLSSYEADGLIIATPTGSTAYSLSVGGAIMAPNTPNFIITAIAPHSLTSRPLVVGNDNILTMEVKSRSGCFLISVDGNSNIIQAEGTLLRIEKADKPVRIIKRVGHTFYETLRNKLKWGTDPRQE